VRSPRYSLLIFTIVNENPLCRAWHRARESDGREKEWGLRMRTRRIPQIVPKAQEVPARSPPSRQDFSTEAEARAAIKPGWSYGPDNPIHMDGKEVFAIYRKAQAAELELSTVTRSRI
jgi:hypothetical protein